MTRPLFLLAALAVALTLGACGSSKDNTSAKSGEDKAFEGALKFAECMREHGIDMPDPTRVAGGGIRQRMGGRGGGPEKGFGPDDPKMKAAMKECDHFMENGGGPAVDPAEQAKRQDAFIAFARCMRGKGIDMPDPKVSGNKVSMMIGRGDKGHRGPDPDSPAFKAADEACHPLLGEVERGGPSQEKAP